MIKILTIIGARPQIIKAAALCRAISNNFPGKIKEVIVHTGQHYDKNMSKVFFDELHIPRPNYNLNIGSASHGKQTAIMMAGIEDIIKKEKPDCMVLYGDTNSTLAGAIAASKTLLYVVHIEAGLRSFNKTMPEEINRIICDHVSTLLFTPTKTGYNNLVAEGFRKNNKPPYNIDNPKIYHCGDLMYDNCLYFSSMASEKTTIIEKNQLKHNDFVLATIHRNNNTDNAERLNSLFKTFDKVSKQNNIRIMIPLHPRTKKLLKRNLSPELFCVIQKNKLIKILPPVSYFEMLALENYSKIILTDSGGVQKEAFFFKKPCVVLRSETEWVELVENGTSIITDADGQRILEAYDHLVNKTGLSYPPIFGDGKAAEFICEEILKIE
ncbi:MAG: UDP-N-acetylglucosamine 2-epimerase (non-hydrolyzing) [Cytophagales bacterium]|nr:UDP-N-acetylglucosamine 2-epimerase (non-hydrolyzing) [Cytophagales bacterium]